MVATPSGTAPTYTKYNGFPCVAFNGTSTKMTTPTTYSFGTTGSTWIAVSVNFSPITTTLPPDASVVMATTGGSPERAIRYNPSTSATVYSIHTGVLRPDTVNNTNGIRGFIETPALFNSYTNGTNTYSLALAVTFQASSNQGLVLGQWNVGWLNGVIFELLIYNRDLTLTEYKQVEAYLAQKWGYKDLLPVGHPGTLSVIVPQVSKSIARPTLYYRNYQLTQIPGCLLWLDAADPAATGAVGTAITSWKDKSGNNNHFTLTSGTATVVQDGPYTVVGIPTGTLLTSTNTIATTANTTVFAVFKATNTAFMMFLAFSGLLSGDLSIRCSSYVVPPGGTTNSNDLFNGVTMYVDGNTTTSATMSGYHIVSGTMSTSGTTAVTISSATFSSGRMFIGNAAEIVMYSGPLTTSQRQTVESYLAQKWGLMAALPAAHPNATVPAGLPPAVPSVMRLIFALSKFMSTVYNLSTYSLVNIANAITANSTIPVYIWTVSVPSAAKGKNAILAIVFNLYSNSQFTANQLFDYGVYVDGVSQFMGDSTTMRYVQTANGNYAIAYNGISLGTNGIMGGLPLFFPLVLSPSASQIQIGIVNSSAYMSGIASASPGYTTSVLTSSGTLNTNNYIPQNTFTSSGATFTYTVPTTCSAGTVTGVYLYLWGTGGHNSGTYPGGAGGYTSGYFQCAGGTVLTCIIGSVGGGSIITGGGGSGYMPTGGGFTGVFNNGAGSINTSTCIGIAGGGGGLFFRGDFLQGSGGAGGGSNGSYGYNLLTNTQITSITPGTQTTGGTIGGAQFLGGIDPSKGGNGDGGGGWFGGGGAPWNSSNGGAGGSGYTGGFTSSGYTTNGMTATGTMNASNVLAGGSNVMTSFGLNSNVYGTGAGATGLIIIIPAIGTNPVQTGVSATLFSA